MSFEHASLCFLQWSVKMTYLTASKCGTLLLINDAQTLFK